MCKDKLLKEWQENFEKLSDENKKYILAISQALLFAQEAKREDKEHVKRMA